MADQKVYPKGIKIFAPRTGAPTFVKGSMVVNPNDLVAWLKQNQNYLTDSEKYGKQLTLDLLEGKDGLYVTVNTFKPTPKSAAPPAPVDDLPF